MTQASARIRPGFWLLASLFAVGPMALPGTAATFAVPCNAGITLAQVLKVAPEGSLIRLSGHCNERVTITTDGLTLEGGGIATIDGSGIGFAGRELNAVVTVAGANNVTLRGLTIQNGPGEGVLLAHGASATLESLKVKQNSGAGIFISENSTARIKNVTASQNRLGMDMINQSEATVFGNLSLTSNQGAGMNINGESSMELRGGHLDISDNATFGAIIGRSHLVIYGFEVSQGSSITADRNGLFGLVIGNGLLTVFGSSFPGSAANKISASNNGVGGIFMPGNGGMESPFGTAEIDLQGNVFGMLLEKNSTADINGGLNVANNAMGIVADAAGALYFASTESNPSNIKGNGTDVDLKFGTRATFEGQDFVGTVVCDDTVLTRGDASCP